MIIDQKYKLSLVTSMIFIHLFISSLIFPSEEVSREKCVEHLWKLVSIHSTSTETENISVIVSATFFDYSERVSYSCTNSWVSIGCDRHTNTRSADQDSSLSLMTQNISTHILRIIWEVIKRIDLIRTAIYDFMSSSDEVCQYVASH